MTWTREWIKAVQNRDWQRIDSMIDTPTLKKKNFGVQSNYAIRLAAKTGQTAIVKKLLLESSVDASARRNEAFCGAAAAGHLDVVNALSSVYAVNVRDRQNLALHLSLFNGHLEVFKYICTICYSNVAPEKILELALRGGALRTLHNKKEVLKYLDDSGYIAPFLRVSVLYLPHTNSAVQIWLRFHEFFVGANFKDCFSNSTVSLFRSLRYKIYHQHSKYFKFDAYEFRRSSRDLFYGRVIVHPLLNDLNSTWRCKITADFYQLYSNDPKIDLVFALGYITRKRTKKNILRTKYALAVEKLLQMYESLRSLSLPWLLISEIYYAVEQPVSNCIELEMVWNMLKTVEVTEKKK